MIFDTDIIIWFQRGNEKARKLLAKDKDPMMSIQSYMELFQAAKSKGHHVLIRDFLKTLNFKILPITENISHRAAVYVEEYTLSHGVRAADALIAATVVENNGVLCTGNRKHFEPIQELQLSVFRP